MSFSAKSLSARYSRPATVAQAAATLILAMNLVVIADANERPAPDPLADPAVVAVIWNAWIESANGKFGIEASFRLDGSQAGYRIVATPFTGQQRRQTIPIIPGVTFAAFHVHTAKADPAPSQADRDMADKYMLKVYSIHGQGLYEYDPVTKRTTKLRDGVKWMTPPKN